MPPRRKKDLLEYSEADFNKSTQNRSTQSSIVSHTSYSITESRVKFQHQNFVYTVPQPTSTAPTITEPIEWNNVDFAVPDIVEYEACLKEAQYTHTAYLDPNYVDEPDINVDDPGVIRSKKPAEGDPVLAKWLQRERERFLYLLLGLEAHTKSVCALCKAEMSESFRCLKCFQHHQLCELCILKEHENLPFHWIQIWNGNFWEKTSLAARGAVFQLGHFSEPCPCPERSTGGFFVVVSHDGIHQIQLQFCGCHGWADKTAQLIEARLFPATIDNPQTAFTFQCLETFQMLNFMSKITPFEYYNTLLRLTDNTFTSKVPDRYHEFLRVLREWRHLRMLKRSGRAYDDRGPANTHTGECALHCPACPIPGINLPSDYKTRADRWKYTLFVGIDANFRLKRLDVSNEQRDPGLNHGYAYIVDTKPFYSYLEKFGEIIIDDKSTCSEHNALKQASAKGGKGVVSTGIGTIDCARHDMKRPASLGDLQKGERYVNMDYIFMSSMNQNAPQDVVVSYDISCQWGRHLPRRFQVYGDEYRPDPLQTYRFLVPKFHLAAHKMACQVQFSFNFTPLVGRTDGEGPERGWSATNAVSTSTREMGPGSRRDTLDDIFGDWNHRKRGVLPSLLLKRMAESLDAREKHTIAFKMLSAALPKIEVEKWDKAVIQWERDPSGLNPYEPKTKEKALKAVQLELAQEDNSNTSTPQIHKVSANSMIVQGLAIQEEQEVLAADNQQLKGCATDAQKTKIIERSTQLRRKIDRFCEIQNLYIPRLGFLRREAEENASPEQAVYSINIMLPSECVSSKVAVTKELCQTEFRLRLGEAHDALESLRRHLLLRDSVWRFRHAVLLGQRNMTRSQQILEDVDKKIKLAAARYRRAFRSLGLLAPVLGNYSWRDSLQRLEDTDIRAFKDSTDLDGTGHAPKRKKKSKYNTFKPQGHRTPSWIWLTTQHHSKQDMAEALGIEWCKARARAFRWQEEVILLTEEMRRTQVFYTWQEKSWLERILEFDKSKIAGTLSSNVRAGVKAYAYRQAHFARSMKRHCEKTWKNVPGMLQGANRIITTANEAWEQIPDWVQKQIESESEKED